MKTHKIYKLFVFCLGFLFLNDCALYQNIQGPVLRVVRRGSCIAIDIPPITLTPARTAAEKQLIGEDIIIEENGWLVASAQSSISNPQNQDAILGFAKLKQYYIELGIIDFYNQTVQKYKLSGLIGETYDGLLELVPWSNLTPTQRLELVEERKVAKKIIDDVNSARIWLWKYNSTGKSDAENILFQEKQDYYHKSLPGEWKRNENGNWEKNSK